MKSSNGEIDNTSDIYVHLVRYNRVILRAARVQPATEVGIHTVSLVIVIGHLANTPTPIPLRVDGKPPATVKSLTVVRWIHPLPPDEKQLRAAEAGEVE